MEIEKDTDYSSVDSVSNTPMVNEYEELLKDFDDNFDFLDFPGRQKSVVIYNDGFPEFVKYDLSDSTDEEEDEEIIPGLLRKQQKMLLTGKSKSGKSFLLIELAVAISNGTGWLGFNCKKGKVLYI